jgi:hypothetical protein
MGRVVWYELIFKKLPGRGQWGCYVYSEGKVSYSFPDLGMPVDLFTVTQQSKVFLGHMCCSGRQAPSPPPLAGIAQNKSPLTVGKLCHRCYIVGEGTYQRR